MQLSANETWFNLEIEGGEHFAVYSFNGEEQASKPFEFSIELVSPLPDVRLADFIGLPAVLSIGDKGPEPRVVHGFVRQMELLHNSLSYTHYRAVIVPRLWFLGRTRNFRIFQENSILAIIDQVLQAQGFAPEETYAFKLFQPEERYKAREYCVQYGESDLHFISRLCEEEGIFYYFEHSPEGHKLVFADMPGGEPIPGESAIRFFPGSGQVSDNPVISRLNYTHSVDTGMVRLKEWNFEKPSLDLMITKEAAQGKGEGMSETAPPEALKLEDYQYPTRYKLRAEGEHYAGIELLRRLSLEKVVEGHSDVSRLMPGYVFSLKEHPNKLLNSSGAGGNGPDWWLLSVKHHGEQPQVLKEAAPERGLVYNASFSAIPAETRYVPPVKHHKASALGAQTAIVTGPEDQEIHTDEYGRVKVKFHWDRLEERNNNTSCWLRVSQGWAGSGYGSMVIPRIGQEVIVSFLSGDPDKPLVTGRVYYATHMPPYELDAHKTRTLFKSMSTPGAEGEERGFNELRVEDLANEEEIYLHAQKDLNAVVLNDWKDHVLNERHSTVDAASYSVTGGEAHEIFKNTRKTEVRADDSLNVSGASHNKIGGKFLVDAGSEIHQKSGLKLVIEAGTEITLKAGGSYIKLDPSGVSLGGAMINLGGGGAPGSGSGAAPQAPDEAVIPEEADKPKAAPRQQQGEAAEAPPSPCQNAALENSQAMGTPLSPQCPET